MAKSSKSWKEKKDIKRLKKQEKALKDKHKLEEKEKDKETEDEIVEQEDTRNKPVSTISIAVPGSILENAQSQELRTYLAGQIARAGKDFSLTIAFAHLLILFCFSLHL